MIDVHEVARQAEVIVGGYAVLRDALGYKVVNLNKAHGAAVLKRDGSLIETDMDPIELSIARKTMLESIAYMEG